MKDKLKQLHSEAVVYVYNLCGKEHPDGPRSFQEVLDEKFAELIILECSKIARAFCSEHSLKISKSIEQLLFANPEDACLPDDTSEEDE